MSFVSKLAAALAAGVVVAQASWPSAALAGSIPRARPEEVGLSSERLARIGPAMQRHIDAGEIAGVVTLVARRGRIAHFEAYGYADIAKRTPMRTDHIFGLASSSKPITAVAIMMLVESGDVRLQDPVSKFIPEFGAPAQVAMPREGGGEGAYELVPATRPITIRDLLTHGSGLMSGGLGQRAAGAAAQRSPQDTLATYIPKLGTVPLDFQPGTLWRYSGLAGFDVLSRVVEVASGQSFDEFLRQHILEPLDMLHTAFIGEPSAAPLGPGFGRVDGQFVDYTSRYDRSLGGAAGGLQSTASDLQRFARALLGGVLLDAQSETEMQDFVPGQPQGDVGHEYGLGLERYRAGDLVVYGHLGSSAAHSAFLAFEPDSGVTATVLINVEDAAPAAYIALEAVDLF